MAILIEFGKFSVKVLNFMGHWIGEGMTYSRKKITYREWSVGVLSEILQFNMEMNIFFRIYIYIFNLVSLIL